MSAIPVSSNRLFINRSNGHPTPAVPAGIAKAIVGSASYLTLPDRRVIGFGIARITPDIAKAVTGINYRSRRNHRVVFYARQMLTGLWQTTPQGLVFFEDGQRADGDHRLNAVIESGQPTDFLVTWGWPTSITSVLDQNLARTPSDYLKATLNLGWSNSEIGAVKYLGLGKIPAGDSHIPNDLLADWAMVLSEAINFVIEAMRCSRGQKRGLFRAEMIAVLAARYYRMEHDDIRRFCVGLTSGLGMNNDHEQVALLARNTILSLVGNHKSESRQTIGIALAYALDLFAKREKRQILRPNISFQEAVALPADIRQQIQSFKSVQSIGNSEE